MKELTQILIEPVISERTTYLNEINKYVFVVQKNANKIEVKHAVEKLFNVKVDKVNIVNVQGKRKRRRFKIGKRPDWKKAIITLQEGQKIELT
ncbi:MAG: 50S ribosomal protein L23 [Candidatus Auribacterota bacterium]|jgi:large subunit ribosomal protein L23|nr:50S ribosomal protein L23 [Candidatus Auribacterota bacterium]